MTDISQREERRRRFRAWYALALLSCLYAVAFVDRLILGLLVEPLRADLHVTDAQIGLLMGVTFALFYAFAGLPLGRLADIANRKRLLIITAIIWGACTFVSGLATSFAMLCILRVGVAVGEAALTPTSLSLIADIFPRHMRARATSIYMTGGAIGATGSYVLGGLVVHAMGSLSHISVPLIGEIRAWQAVFFVVGIPPFVLAALIALTFKEPPREQLPGSSRRGFTFAWARRPYFPVFLLYVATAVGNIILFGINGWTPTYLIRQFHWSAGAAGVHIGIVSMTAAIASMLLIPRIVEVWTARGRKDALAIVLAGGLLLGFLFVVAACLVPGPYLFLAFLAAAMFCIMGIGILPHIAVQWAIPSRMRGEVSAAGILGNALVAQGGGPTAVIFAASIFGGGQYLGYGLALVAAICGPMAAFFVILLRKPLMTLFAGGDEPSSQPS